MKTRGLLFALVALLAAATAAAAAGSGRHLTAREHAQINATLDAFVNHAVKRQDVGASYDAVTASFRGGMSREEWSRGSIPVFPYPAGGTKFHGWTVQYLTGNELGVQLILMPQRGSGVGAAAFQMTLRRVHGRWLVDSMVPGATFAPAGKPARVVGTYDFGPGSQNATAASDVHQISGAYGLIPFAVLAFLLVAIGAMAVVGVVRHRRVVGVRDGRLPPLPRRQRSRA